jgi:hypothetical protein
VWGADGVVMPSRRLGPPLAAFWMRGIFWLVAGWVKGVGRGIREGESESATMRAGVRARLAFLL